MAAATLGRLASAGLSYGVGCFAVATWSLAEHGGTTRWFQITRFQRFEGDYSLKYGNADRVTTDHGARPIVHTPCASLECDGRLTTQLVHGRNKIDDAYIVGVGSEF